MKRFVLRDRKKYKLLPSKLETPAKFTPPILGQTGSGKPLPPSLLALAFEDLKRAGCIGSTGESASEESAPNIDDDVRVFALPGVGFSYNPIERLIRSWKRKK